MVLVLRAVLVVVLVLLGGGARARCWWCWWRLWCWWCWWCEVTRRGDHWGVGRPRAVAERGGASRATMHDLIEKLREAFEELACIVELVQSEEPEQEVQKVGITWLASRGAAPFAGEARA